LLAFASDEAIQKLIAQSLAGEKTPQWTKLLLLDVIGRSELATLPSVWQSPLFLALRSDDTDTIRAAVTAIASIDQSLDQQDRLAQGELLVLTRNEKLPSDLRVAAAAAAMREGDPLPDAVFELLAEQCRPTVEPVTRLSAAGVIGSAKLEASRRDQVIELIGEASPLELPALMRAVENTELSEVGRQLIHSLESSPGLSALPVDRLAKLVERLPSDVRPEADTLFERNNFDLDKQRKRLDELKDALIGGDVERGRLLFFGSKASCSACHRIGQEGGDIGPNLAGIGEIRTRRDLLEAVAFPSASFARNFEPYVVLTTSGTAHAGIVSRTTSDAVYLITGERATIRIPREEIEDDGLTPSNVSIMPQGLDQILNPEELKDLLAFLASLREQQ
jgi:putative heme-binding domain-containing protein